MFFIILLFVFVRISIEATLIGPSSDYLGALSATNLGHGMYLFVNYTQYDDRLSYGVWFYNPEKYAYWDTHECLLYIVGTPSVVDLGNNECTFDKCITVHGSNVDIKDNCRNQEFQLEAHIVDLEKTKYIGLNQLYAAAYTGVTINPNEDHSILYQSVYSKLGQAKEKCSNFQLGNGTIFDFTYAQRDGSGHFYTNDFSSHLHQTKFFTLIMSFMTLIYLK